MEKSAVLHIMNGEYVYKISDHKYLIKILTKANDLKSLNFCYYDKYDWSSELVKVPMNFICSDDIHDLYELEFETHSLSIKYFFELISPDEVLYYGASEFSNDLIVEKDSMFTFVPHMCDASFFKLPEWAKGTSYYQIFSERFNPTDKYVGDWDLVPMTRNASTNGTLFGIAKKLPYLKELGIEGIYLTPIFLAGTNHRYDTYDYFKVCPRLGGEEGLRTLVSEAHKLGIKIILDLVFNHTSTKFFAFEDVLKNQEKSLYKDWYFIKKWPLKVEKDYYDSFAYHPYMPKLNTMNKEVEAYLLKVSRYYLEEFKVDGYRLDVCDEVSHHFWRKFREVVKEINPEAIIIGEIWFDSMSFLAGDECDTVMNYTLETGIIKLLNEKINVEAFKNLLARERMLYKKNYLDYSLNILSTHDTRRIYHVFNQDVKKTKFAYALTTLLKGSSYCYYGDEQLMDGGYDPDCRRGMDFNHNLLMYAFIARLNALKKFEAFKAGEFKVISTSKNVFKFIRYTDKDTYTFIGNLNKEVYKLEEDVLNLIDNKEVHSLDYLDFVVYKNC